MCEALRVKATGEKPVLVNRLVAYYAPLLGHNNIPIEDKIISTIGPASSEGVCKDVRTFYKNNFSSLDRFDRHWYEMTFIDHPHKWESYFAWSLIHCAILNARAAFCSLKNARFSVKEFLVLCVTDPNDKFQ